MHSKSDQTLIFNRETSLNVAANSKQRGHVLKGSINIAPKREKYYGIKLDFKFNPPKNGSRSLHTLSHKVFLMSGVNQIGLRKRNMSCRNFFFKQRSVYIDL